MPGLSIPASPREITPEWLTEALRSASTISRASVASFKIQPIAVGQGFTSQIVRLNLSYDVQENGAPKSLIAKLPSADTSVRRILNGLGLYGREVRFYEDIAPTIKLRTPRRYYSASNGDSGECVLLLEDLAPAKSGDNLRGCSLVDAELAIRELASFHTQWWNTPRLAGLEWLRGSVRSSATGQQIYSSAWDAFAAKLGGSLPEPFREIAEALRTRLARAFSPLAQTPQTFLHGDYRLDNLYFGCADGSPLAVADWQLASRGPGVLDVAYFLVWCADPGQRRRTEDKLLETYHSTLVENGVGDYPIEKCASDYRHAMIHVLGRTVVSGGILDFSSERGGALVEALVKRTNAALEDHNIAELLS